MRHQIKADKITTGAVFKTTPEGVSTDLHDFSQTDGRSPSGPLVQAPDGNFYATTAYGGANDQGTIFKMTSAGMVTQFTHAASMAH